MIKTKIITKGGIVLALSFISFIIFKGVANIFNSFIIPFTIYIFFKNENLKDMILSLTSICIFTFIFFRLQSFFIIRYCIIAYALFVENKKTLKRVNILIINTSLISLILWLGTTLTDIFFNTKINLVLKGITGNSIELYVLIYLFEGLIISVILYVGSEKLGNRLKNLVN